jgi:hypothetical protein
MKNLPEEELFNSIENRLRDYSELPDDETWNKIAGVILPVTEPSWIVWMNRTAAALSLLVLILLSTGNNNSYNDSANGLQSNPKNKKEQAEPPFTLVNF